MHECNSDSHIHHLWGFSQDVAVLVAGGSRNAKVRQFLIQLSFVDNVSSRTVISEKRCHIPSAAARCCRVWFTGIAAALSIEWLRRQTN